MFQKDGPTFVELMKQALSSTERGYDMIAPKFDYTPFRTPDEVLAIMAKEIGEPLSIDAALDVCCGTGAAMRHLRPLCRERVVGIDFSSGMLEKARERVARERMDNVRLLQMDAADLKFADHTFDIVYAPYLISVVPDPVKVAREMRRVCRPGGRIVFLNHFLSPNPALSRLERAISPMTIHIGFRSDLDLPAFLTQAELTPVSIQKVNIPRIWSLVTCVKDN